MRGAYVRSLGPDQVELTRPARPSRLALPVLLTVGFGAVIWVSGGSIALGFATVGAFVLPLVTVKAFRQALSRRHVLVRASGRLMLDGEPLEAARIELRVLKHWLLRRPQKYALSLWALVGRGDQLDVELGHYASMLEASQLSGQMEEFLERSKQRAPGRAPTGD